MRASYLWLIAIAGVVYLITDDRKSPSTANGDTETACSAAFASMRDSLFPKDTLIETEAWVIDLANSVGIKTPELTNRVANYEVGRATSVSIKHDGKFAGL